MGNAWLPRGFRDYLRLLRVLVDRVGIRVWTWMEEASQQRTIALLGIELGGSDSLLLLASLLVGMKEWHLPPESGLCKVSSSERLGMEGGTTKTAVSMSLHSFHTHFLFDSSIPCHLEVTATEMQFDCSQRRPTAEGTPIPQVPLRLALASDKTRRFAESFELSTKCLSSR